jgi:hypothetical protein
VELIGCNLTKFGYPNDEAWCNIPRTKNLLYVECIARDLKLELKTEPYSKTIAAITSRIL